MLQSDQRGDSLCPVSDLSTGSLLRSGFGVCGSVAKASWKWGLLSQTGSTHLSLNSSVEMLDPHGK